jgi:hypothetical protein
MRRLLYVISVTSALLLGPSKPATAATIQYQATDLPDLVVGEDLWQYEYSPSGLVFQVDQGFAVFFDYTLYDDLQLVAPLPPDWDPIVANPIPALTSNGFYDALALVNAPSLAGPFRVSFTWLGAPGTAPGSQPFEIYELDAQGAPVPFESGQTIAPSATEVPEPSTMFLVMTGVAVARGLRKRRSQYVRQLPSSFR